VYCQYREGSTDDEPETDEQVSVIDAAHDQQASSSLPPTLCRLQELRNARRENNDARGGLIHDKANDVSWTTDIRFGVSSYGTFRGGFDECDGDTVCELLKMSGRERIRDRRESLSGVHARLRLTPYSRCLEVQLV
jgi:hypothetical protein